MAPNKPNPTAGDRGARGNSSVCDADNFPDTANAIPRQARRAEGQHCGAEIGSSGKRSGRKARFCSAACKHRAFRRAKWVSRYGTADPRRNESKNAAVSSTSTGTFRGRGIDLAGLQPELRRRILQVELPHLRAI